MRSSQPEWAWVKVGMKVSAKRWDKTEHLSRQIGSPAVVTAVEGSRSQSGYLVTVRGASGREETLDMDWFDRWSE